MSANTTASDRVKPAPPPKDPNTKSELREFAQLLDRFFAKLGI